MDVSTAEQARINLRRKKVFEKLEYIGCWSAPNNHIVEI